MRSRGHRNPTNVFVLGTGRCGTGTFVEACKYLDNYSAGHETLSREFGPSRFGYPACHIEADNRLAWFLGELGRCYDGTDVLYVHLRRDREATAASFAARFDSPYRASMIRAFAHGIVQRSHDIAEGDRLDVCRFYVDTVTANIDEFLSSRPSMTVRLDHAADDFPGFLDRIGATGDLGAATAEWRVRHNARR